MNFPFVFGTRASSLFFGKRASTVVSPPKPSALNIGPIPDDQSRLAPAARGEHCGFSISGEGISDSTRTACGWSLKSRRAPERIPKSSAIPIVMSS